MFQMEFEKDILGLMMQMDEGAQKFVADLMLLLTPEEIKNCRLVCHQWDNFIKGRLWKEGSGRRLMRQKLEQRWKTVDPVTGQMAEVGQSVHALYSDDAHVFVIKWPTDCKILVFDLASGQLSGELVPSPQVENLYQLAGGKGIVAAHGADSDLSTYVTIWSSLDEMEKIHVFDGKSFNCPNDSCGVLDGEAIYNIHVVGTKRLAILAFDSSKASLVTLEKGDQGWGTKVLGCFAVNDFLTLSLASDGDWLAVKERSDVKVKLWRATDSCEDIVLPEVGESECLDGLHLEIPYLILVKLRLEQDRPHARPAMDCIMVYKMEGKVPCHVKSINVNGYEALGHSLTPISNQFCIGFSTHGDWIWGRDYDSLLHGGEREIVVLQFMKKDLVNSKLAPDQTMKRVIRVGVQGYGVVLNTTSYVSAVRGQNPRRDPFHLIKKDFWTSANIC